MTLTCLYHDAIPQPRQRFLFDWFVEHVICAVPVIVIAAALSIAAAARVT
jgi:hypothetical protein